MPGRSHSLRWLGAGLGLLLALIGQPLMAAGAVGLETSGDETPPPVRHVWTEARPKPIDVQHIHAELFVDPLKGRLHGEVTLSVLVLESGLTAVTLDQQGLRIGAAYVDEGPAEFVLRPGLVSVSLAEPASAGDTLRVRLAYAAEPREGMYFHLGDPRDPEARLPFAYTQGQTTTTHHWLPCFDAPNDKVRADLVVTVPAGMVGLSNGRLVERRDLADGRSVWHWRQDRPHSIYLTTLVVGPFQQVRDATEDWSVAYWALPEQVEAAERCLADTPRMLALFEEAYGTPYPWDRYDQVVVPRFRFGGMENTSLSTLTAATLHDPIAALDGASSEGLVAHELAHQWFGNLATVASWPHVWLHEGFATHAEALWTEYAHGDDEARWRFHRYTQRFMRADRRQPRPIVRTDLSRYWEVFDGRTYQKGAWVVHMLRHRLGEERFRAVLREYLHTFGRPDTFATTQDLWHIAKQHADAGRAAEDERDPAGAAEARVPMDQFFEQWLYRAGWPVLRLSWTHDDGDVRIRIAQRQEVNEVWPVFHFDVPLALRFGEGPDAREQIVWAHVRGRDTTVVVPSEAAPLRVRFDPAYSLLRELTVEQSDAAWRDQLRHDPCPIARREALAHFSRRLANGRDAAAASAALLQALHDPFARLRAEALERIAGHLREQHWPGEALPALTERVLALAGDGDEPTWVRAEAVVCLPYFGVEAARELVAAFAADPPAGSYAIRANAITAHARLAGAEAVPALLAALDDDSHGRAAAAALTALRRLDASRAIEEAVRRVAPGHQMPLRRAALRIMHDAWEDGTRSEAAAAYTAALLAIAVDLRDDWRFRSSVIDMLGEFAMTRPTADALREHRRRERDPGVIRRLDAFLARFEDDGE